MWGRSLAMYVAQFENKNSPGDVRQPLKQNRYCYFPLILHMMWILCDLLVLPGILFVSLEHASKSSFIFFLAQKNKSIPSGKCSSQISRPWQRYTDGQARQSDGRTLCNSFTARQLGVLPSTTVPFLFSSSRPPWPPADPESLMPQTTTFQKGFNLHRLSRRTPGCQSISLRGG